MMRLPGEPSVDEILDSIKKVIARDDRAGLAARQQIGRDGAAPRLEESDHDDVLDLADSASVVTSGDEPDAPTPVDQAEAPPLVTAESRAAMRESLAALAMMAEPAASPQILRSGETSLEGLARELLRPALAEWLDRHLPAMVEKLVAREIARIVGKTS